MDETEPTVVVIERRRGMGCVSIALVLFAAVWCIGGVTLRGRLLGDWNGDYQLSKQAREHPFIARLVAPESAVQAAEEFAADYESLQSSNMLTATLYCFEAVSSHRRLIAALGGGTSSETKAPAAQGAGTTVVTVSRDSNAARNGIRAGDIITAYNGKPINSGDDLRRSIDAAAADYIQSSANIVVVRGSNTLQFKVSTGKLGITTNN